MEGALDLFSLISHGEMHELQLWEPRCFTWNDSNANMSCMTVTLVILEIYTCIREHKQIMRQ